MGNRRVRSRELLRRPIVVLGLGVLLLAAVGASSALAASGQSPAQRAAGIVKRDFPGLSGSKQRMIGRELARGLTAAPAPKPPDPSSLPVPVQTPAEGTVTSQDSPLPHDVFAPTGNWSGPFGGAWWDVFAGQQGPDDPAGSSLAEVVVFQQPADVNSGQPWTYVGSFGFPGLTSSFAIQSVSDGVVTLTDQSGGSYAFSLSSDTFSGAATPAGASGSAR